jgi:hypothetical protein
MKVGDVVDELLVHASDPRSAVNMGAILALNALWTHHAPDNINGPPGGWAGRQVPDEAIELVRESLLAALAALKASGEKHPTNPGELPS